MLYLWDHSALKKEHLQDQLRNDRGRAEVAEAVYLRSSFEQPTKTLSAIVNRGVLKTKQCLLE